MALASKRWVNNRLYEERDAGKPRRLLWSGGVAATGIDLTKFAIGYEINPDGDTWNEVRIFAGYVDGTATPQTDLTLTATSIVYLKLVYPNTGAPTPTIEAAESLPADTDTDKYCRLYEFTYDGEAETVELATVFRTLNIDGALKIPQGSQAEGLGTQVLVWDQTSGAWIVDEPSFLLPDGSNTGDLLYWDNAESEWAVLARPASGNYVLMCQSGTVSWVEVEAFSCPV